MTRIARLKGERARFECKLSPLAAGGNGPFLPSQQRPLIMNPRPQRAASVGVDMSKAPASRNHQQHLASDVGGGGGGGCENNSNSNNNADLQDGAMIDETPARADALMGQPRIGRSYALSPIGPKFLSQESSQMESDESEYGGDESERARIQTNSNNDHFLDDSVELILWYHSSESAIQPIYSVDARSRPQPQHQQIVHNQYTNYTYNDNGKQSFSSSSGPGFGSGSQSTSDPLVPVNFERQFTIEDGLMSEENSIEQSDGKADNKLLQLNYNELNSTSNSRKLSEVSNNNKDNNNNYSTKFVSNAISRNAKHYALSRLSRRIRLRISDAKAYLIIDKVEAGDAGQYKCRVDFKYARTRYQLSQLEVITPVTEVRIKTTNKQGTDLWPKDGEEELLLGQEPKKSRRLNSADHLAGSLSKWPTNNKSVPHFERPPRVVLIEANEDETLNFECKAEDGWPKAKLAWWRVDWQRALDLEEPNGIVFAEWKSNAPKVTQLSSSPSDSLAKVSNSIAASPTTNQPGSLKELPYLIKANTMVANGAGSGSVNTGGRQTNIDPTNDGFGNDKGAIGYSNLVDTDDDDDDRHWFAWMAGQLREAISKLGHDEKEEYLNSTSPPPPPPPQSLSARSRVSIDLVVQDLAAALNYFGPDDVNTQKKKQSQVLVSSTQTLTPNSNSSGNRAAEMWQFSCQNRLVLYICGASNTRSHNKLLLGQQRQTVDNVHRDKLASIRPIFRSILVQPNAWPKWIRMFLVSRRALAGRNNGQQIELTLLRENQNLHLNLADKLTFIGNDGGKEKGREGEGERQLEFVCQVGGSLPEANIEWTRQDQDITGKSIVRPLVSDSHLETQSLIRALAASNITSTKINSTFTTTNKQWSSLRVHNISIGEHQTVIRCSAYNEKFNLASSSILNGARTGAGIGHEDSRARVSTSVGLNITHVPSIRLELESSLSLSSNLFIDNHNNRELTKLTSPVVGAEGSPKNVSSPINSGALSFNNNNTSSSSRSGSNVQLNNSGDVKPILYGHNVTLICNVAFANPAIIEPIEWTLNNGTHTKPLDKVTWLVRVVGKMQIWPNRYHFIERLIVQFTDRSQSESQLKLECKARNALGQIASNTLGIVTGQLPHCSIRSSEEPDNQDLTTDKDLPVHCPMISDKSSSTFHWLALLVEDGSVAGGSGGKATIRETTLSTSGNLIPLSKLNLTSISDANNSLKTDGLRIYCYASDKFGSNDKSPCLIRIRVKEFNGKVDDASTRATHNCAANLVQKSLVQKRQQQDNLSLSSHQTIDQANSITTTISTKPKLLLTIECKDNQFKDKDELVHFDLYNKRDTHFIKHLTSSYLNDDKYENENGESRLTNLSLMFDLGKELETLPVEDIENQHVIVMSITDINNRPKQPNVTLHFNTDLTPGRQNTLSADRFPRTSDSGHRDRLWVISSMSIVLITTFLLVIIAWVCKSGSSGSALKNKKRKHDLNNNSINHDAQCDSQTEMYLVGEEPRLAIYHNAIHHAATNQSLQPNENQCKPTIITATTTTTNNPYDFLIIDPTPTDAIDGNKQAILFIGPEPRPCTRSYNHQQQQQGYSAAVESNGERYHIKPMIQFHPVTDLHEDAIFRAYYKGDGEDDCDENMRILSNGSNSSTSCQGGDIVNINNSATSNSQLGSFDLTISKQAHLIKSSIGIVSATSPNGYNLELNSQGELTMTDESSSFIHELADGQASSNGDPQICSRQCNIDIMPPLSGQTQYNYLQRHHDHHQQQVRRGVLCSQCIECRKLNNTTPVDPEINLPLTANNSNQCHSPSSSSSQSSVQQMPTLKRMVPNQKRVERVRFVSDYQYEG